MADGNVLEKVVAFEAVDRVAVPVAKAVRDAYDAAGPAGRNAKNFMHGVWLGHPLHPVFTDIPLGAWTAALVLDLVDRGDSGMRRAARHAVGVGILGALGSAVSGLTDWSETGGRSRRMGFVHGLLNVVATGLYAASWFERRGGSSKGKTTALAGYLIAATSAYLGGELVYSRRIGVTHAAIEEPETFTAVAASDQVGEGTMMRARKDGADVLLVRQHGRLHALAHSCSHMGGPLSEGTLKDGSIVCPWHGSEFALEDGRVLNGPATQAQPVFEVREQDGSIEVKAPE